MKKENIHKKGKFTGKKKQRKEIRGFLCRMCNLGTAMTRNVRVTAVRTLHLFSQSIKETQKISKQMKQVHCKQRVEQLEKNLFPLIC